MDTRPRLDHRAQADRRTVTVIRNDCGEKMMCDAARKGIDFFISTLKRGSNTKTAACIALDCSDESDPDRKQDLATSLKVIYNWLVLTLV